MKDRQELENSQRGGWPWLAFFVVFAVLLLSRSPTQAQSLLAGGFFFIGFFAYYNNPMALAQRPLHRLGAVHKVSLLCGFVGIISILAAAMLSWL